MFLINTNSTSGANGIPDRKNIKNGNFTDNSITLSDYIEVIKANDTEFYAKKSNNTIEKLDSNLQKVEDFSTDKTWNKLKEETADLGSFGLRYFIKGNIAYKNIFIGEDEKILFTNTDFWYKKTNEDAVFVSKRFYNVNNEYKQINLTGPCMVAFNSGSYEIFTRPSEENTEIAKKIANLVGVKMGNIISMSCLLNNYDIVDKIADNENAVDYIFNSEVATQVIMNNEVALQKIDENEKIMMKILSILSGTTTTGYTNIAGLVENTNVMNKIAKKPSLVKGLLKSDITIDAILDNEDAMNILFDNLVIVNLFVNNKKARNKILEKEVALIKVVCKKAKLNILQFSDLDNIAVNSGACNNVFNTKKAYTLLYDSNIYKTDTSITQIVCSICNLSKSDYVDMNAVAGNETAMNAIAGNETAMTAVAGSETAMTAVAGSETAMTAVAGSETAMTAVAGSETAMTAVAGSETAMTAVAGSETAMTAVLASETAMTAVAGSETAMTAVLASETLDIFMKDICSNIISKNKGNIVKKVEDYLRNKNKGQTIINKLSSSNLFNKNSNFYLMPQNRNSAYSINTRSSIKGSIFIPTTCNDDGDTNFYIRYINENSNGYTTSNQLYIPAHSGNVATQKNTYIGGYEAIWNGSSSGGIWGYRFDVK